MVSPTDVANQSLGLLGESRITDILADPVDPYADLVQRFYAPARDAILSLTDWDFASGWTTLTKLTEAPAAQWDAQYALPEAPDVLMVWALDHADAPWLRAFDPTTQQQVIYTDLTGTVGAWCTFRIQDTGVWSPLAIQALAYKLAADIALSRTGQTRKWQAMMEGMQLWLTKATGSNRKSRFQVVTPSAGLTRIRH